MLPITDVTTIRGMELQKIRILKIANFLHRKNFTYTRINKVDSVNYLQAFSKISWRSTRRLRGGLHDDYE